MSGADLNVQNYIIDEALLLVSDINSDMTIRDNVSSDSLNLEARLMSTVAGCYHALIETLKILPIEIDDNVQLSKLPEPKTLLPRVRPIPKPKPLTRWERFAKEKGIQKKKKPGLVYSETKEDYVPRYGKHREDNLRDEWVIETPKGMASGLDPFEIKASQKKERAAKNELSRLKNISHRQNNKTSEEPLKHQSKKIVKKSKSKNTAPKTTFKNFHEEKNFALLVLNSLQNI